MNHSGTMIKRINIEHQFEDRLFFRSFCSEGNAGGNVEGRETQCKYGEKSRLISCGRCVAVRQKNVKVCKVRSESSDQSRALSVRAI